MSATVSSSVPRDTRTSRRIWITIAQASRLIGASKESIIKLADAGKLSSRRIPDSGTLVNRAEVIHLGEKFTVPATDPIVPTEVAK